VEGLATLEGGKIPGSSVEYPFSPDRPNDPGKMIHKYFMEVLNDHNSHLESFQRSQSAVHTIQFWWYEFIDTEGQFTYSAKNSCRRRGDLPEPFGARDGFQEQAFTVCVFSLYFPPQLLKRYHISSIYSRATGRYFRYVRPILNAMNSQKKSWVTVSTIPFTLSFRGWTAYKP
jgi:hypothetical protein